ncbi:hypothetical protein BDV19DRAFT_201522 [Aspergillus venezuelensis]
MNQPARGRSRIHRNLSFGSNADNLTPRDQTFLNINFQYLFISFSFFLIFAFQFIILIPDPIRSDLIPVPPASTWFHFQR